MLFYCFGVKMIDFVECLFDFVLIVFCEVLLVFGCEIFGYDYFDVVFMGVEMWMFFLICIICGDDFQSFNIVGLFLVGEGVGYVGGILLVGVDGIKIVEVVVWSLVGMVLVCEGVVFG